MSVHVALCLHQNAQTAAVIVKTVTTATVVAARSEVNMVSMTIFHKEQRGARLSGGVSRPDNGDADIERRSLLLKCCCVWLFLPPIAAVSCYELCCYCVTAISSNVVVEMPVCFHSYLLFCFDVPRNTRLPHLCPVRNEWICDAYSCFHLEHTAIMMERCFCY